MTDRDTVPAPLDRAIGSVPPGCGTVPAPPADDADVPRFLADLGIRGIVDVHVHFLPERMLAKVWAYFDAAESHYGTAWPVHYRTPEDERVATLRKLGVQACAAPDAPLRARAHRHHDGRHAVLPAVRAATDHWTARLVDVADRVVFGSDFPNIPYAYAEQVAAVAGWAAADDRLGAAFLRSVLHDAPSELLGLSGS